MWLDQIFRLSASHPEALQPVTIPEYLQIFPNTQPSLPAYSTWGEGGYCSFWLNGNNDWIYPHLHAVADRMNALTEAYPDPTPLVRRALNQAARECLLLQSSDWSFILTTGARWRNVNVPGESEYRNRGVAYCPHCDGPLFKGKRVAVIGGGNSGVEAAIDLAGVVGHVTVVEFMDQLKADAVLVSKLKSLPNVSIVVNAQTTEIHGDGKTVNALSYKDRANGQARRIDLEGVFVQIGLVPNTEFLKGSIELSRFGEIVVDHHGATNLHGVFAAGDATTVPYKQIVIAAGDGAKAALGAFDYLIRSSAPPVEAAAA